MDTRRECILILLLAVTVALAACGGKECTRESYLDGIRDIQDEWSTAINLAADLPEMSENERGDASSKMMTAAANAGYMLDEYEPPACAEKAHGKFRAYVRFGIDAIFEMLDGNMDESDRLIGLSLQAMDEWEALIAELP